MSEADEYRPIPASLIAAWQEAAKRGRADVTTLLNAATGITHPDGTPMARVTHRIGDSKATFTSEPPPTPLQARIRAYRSVGRNRKFHIRDTLVLSWTSTHSSDGTSGLRAEEVSQRPDLSPEVVKPLLWDLVARGQVLRTGVTRGTRYYPVSIDRKT